MSDHRVVLGKVAGGTLYSESASASPVDRKYTLIDDKGQEREVLRDEARQLIVLIKPSGRPDKSVARYASDVNKALAGLNLSEKGLRDLDRKMAVLVSPDGRAKGYDPGPQCDPGFKSVGAPTKRFAPVGDEGKLPTPKGDVGLRTPKEAVARTGGLGIPKDTAPELTRYDSVWVQLDKAMLDPKKINLDPLFRKLNEAKTIAGISEEQFQQKALPKLRQWMLSIGDSIQNARVQEANDEFNNGPIVRPSGLDAYAGVQKLKAAVFALDPTGHFTEGDIRDISSPGWQQVLVALNKEFDNTLNSLSTLPRTKDPKYALSKAEMLYAEARSLASYILNPDEAMAQAKKVYDETVVRVSG